MSVLRESSTAPGAEPTEAAAGSAGPAARSTARFPHLRELIAGGLFVAVLLAIVEGLAQPLSNTDTYFHLRFGEEFRTGSWSLWHPGSVSTFATQSWLPTQWLPEVVMAQFEHWAGLAGVAWLAGTWVIGLVAALYLLARRRAEPLFAVLALMPTLAAMSLGLSARPQVLSYVLTAVTLAAWLGTRVDGRPRWWLIPLTWLWAMLHGMWPIGIGLGVVVLVGLALDRAMGRRDLAKAALVPVGSAVAAALTPLGPALYGAVVGVGDRAQFFTEWQRPDYSQAPGVMVLYLCLAATVVLFLRGSRRSWTDILLLVTAAACSISSYRTVPIGAILLLPLMAGAVQDLSRHREASRPRRTEVGLVLGGCLAAMAALALAVPHAADEPMAEPSWLDPAVSPLPAGTKVVSDAAFGSYLMWRYPELDPLMHGYGDTFTIAELTRNRDIIEVRPGWREELAGTGCTLALLDPTTPLADALEHDGWTVTHHSSSLEMLISPDAS
jgi:hypothetical protein